MKKLIIAVAVFGMAVCANAAVAKWMVTNVRTPSASNPTKAETGIIPDTTAAFLEGLVIDISYNGTKITDGTTNANGLKTQTEFWSQAKVIEAADAAESKILSFDLSATYTASEGVYTYSGSMSADLTNVYTGQKDVPITFNAGTVGSWSFTPGASPIPEPTSGLLLLLGVAGLALRRRRA